MVHVNRALDILGDPVKRAIYDNGEDPDNPGARGQQEKMKREREEDERRKKRDKERAAQKSKENKDKKRNSKTKEDTNKQQKVTKMSMNFADYHIGTDPFGLGGNPWDL